METLIYIEQFPTRAHSVELFYLETPHESLVTSKKGKP